MFCTYCNTENPNYATFCARCGRSLKGEHASIPALAGVSANQRPITEQLNVPSAAFPMQQAQPTQQSDQQASPAEPTLRATPPTPIAIPDHVAVHTNGSSPPISGPPTKRPPGKRPAHWRVITLIALIILLVGGSAPFLISWLSTVLPAASGTMTITPASQHLNQVYTINAVTGTPDPSQNQVQARVLSFTTSEQSKTVKATGQGHQDATTARGRVTITPNTGTIPASRLRVQSDSGVYVIIDVPFPVSAISLTFDAQAEKAGSGGNIPAYNINGLYNMVDDTSITFYLQNAQAFTGGQNASDYKFVQQSDINDAATALTTSLTPGAEAEVRKQLRANEQFVNAPDCTSNIQANHKENDKANDVTVRVKVTCKGESYDDQAARTMATDRLGHDTVFLLKGPHILVGDIITGTPLAIMTDESNTVRLDVRAQGIWVYQFSNAQKQTIANSIAGKPLADAQALLQKQTGVQKFSIKTAGGWGSALPTSPGDIKFVLLPVSGLRTPPTI